MCQNESKGTNLYLCDIENHIYSNSIKSIIVQWFSTIIRKIHAKIEKIILVRFLENGLTKQKMSKFGPWRSKNNRSSDSTKSSSWYVVYVIPKKLHGKKKLLDSFEKVNFKIVPIWPHANFLTPKKPMYNNFLAHTSLQLMKTTLN